MSDDGTPRKYGDMAPGVEQAIEAGDTLVLRDNDGNEFAVKGIEHPDVLEFFKAFDNWLTVKRHGTISAGVLATLWSEVEDRFNTLPMHVQRTLPSFKKLGIPVGDHDH